MQLCTISLKAHMTQASQRTDPSGPRARAGTSAGMAPLTTKMVKSSIALCVASVHVLSLAAARGSPKPAAPMSSSFLPPVRTRFTPAEYGNVSGSPQICDLIMRVLCWHLEGELTSLCLSLRAGNLLLTTNNKKRSSLLLEQYCTELVRRTPHTSRICVQDARSHIGGRQPSPAR